MQHLLVIIACFGSRSYVDIQLNSLWVYLVTFSHQYNGAYPGSNTPIFFLLTMLPTVKDILVKTRQIPVLFLNNLIISHKR